MGFSLHPIMVAAGTAIAAFAQAPGFALARAGVQQQAHGLRQLQGAGGHDGAAGADAGAASTLWIEARVGSIGGGEGPLRKLLQGCHNPECLERCSACTFIEDDDIGHCKTGGQLFNCMRMGAQDGRAGDGGNKGAVPSPRLSAAQRQQPEELLTGAGIGIASRADTETLDSLADDSRGGSTAAHTPGHLEYEGYVVERGPQISVDYEHPVGALVAMKSARRTGNYVGAVVYGVSALSQRTAGPIAGAEHASSSSSASDEDTAVWARRLLGDDGDYASGGEVEDVMYYIDDGKYFVEAGPHIEVDYANGVPMGDYHSSDYS